MQQLNALFKSIIDQDRSPIVICDPEHTIVYMNPTAIRRYHKRGGAALIGRDLLACHSSESAAAIRRVVDWFRSDPSHNTVYTFHNDKENKDVYMVALRDDAGALIGYYEKHEYRDHESDSFYHMT